MRAMSLRAHVYSSLLVVAVASTASAQPAPAQPAPAKQPAPAAQPAPPPPANAPTQVNTVATEDEPIPPVVPPTKMLSNWREAVALASAENPDYSIALLEVDRLAGVERQTLAGTLPTVTATGSVTFNIIRSDIQSVDIQTGSLQTITIPASPTALAQVSLRQPLIAPRVWWAIGTASDQTDLARTNVEDKKRILIGGVADAIVTVVTAERMAEVNRVSVKAAQDRLRLMKKRRELGAGSDLDVVRFEQDLVVAKSSLIQGDETLRRARERLGLALGTTVDYGVRPDIAIDDIQVTLERACGAGELADRADLRALRQQRDLSERALTDADLLYVPTADLSSTFTYSSEELIGDKHYSFSITGILTVPIWDGGFRYGVRRSAEAVVKQQDERLDAATRSASIEVTQAQRAVAVSQQSLEIAQSARDLAAQTDVLVRKSFADGGNVTSFDLVDAARRLREAELTLTVRELELIRSKITALLASSNCTGLQ